MIDEERTRQMRAAAPALAPAPRDPAPGDVIGSWTIACKLGGGGFGNVYEVRHQDTGRAAALKVLHAHFVASAEMLARFDREIRVLATLQHPHIVQIVDAGFDAAGRPYLATELLVGRPLGLAIGDRGLAPAAALALFEPLCDAIAFAHERGIVHRDLKASNVFVCDDGRVVLLDFGIAKISDALAPELTASNQTLGTPGSMAPEQIHGGRIDARTDVYALGGLLFHLLTGRLPFHDPSETMTQYLHLHARRPRASAIAPVAEPIDDVIMRAMAIEPADRHDSVRALVTAIRPVLRESRAPAATTRIEHGAIFATVADRTSGNDIDEHLIDDLEAALPVIERHLVARGFSLGLDLGSSAVFVAPLAAADPVEAALGAWDDVAQRTGADARVRIGLCVHRGPAVVSGARIEPCALLRPDSWGMPDPLEGVWVTAAIEPTLCRVR